MGSREFKVAGSVHTLSPHTHPSGSRQLQHDPHLVGVDAGLRVQQHIESLAL